MQSLQRNSGNLAEARSTSAPNLKELEKNPPPQQGQILVGPKNRLIGGLIEDILEWLLFLPNIDPELLDTFLLSYRKFLSPIRLLGLLIAKVEQEPLAGIAPEEAPMRKKVFFILDKWVHEYLSYDFSRKKMKSRLKVSRRKLTMAAVPARPNRSRRLRGMGARSTGNYQPSQKRQNRA